MTEPKHSGSPRGAENGDAEPPNSAPSLEPEQYSRTDSIAETTLDAESLDPHTSAERIDSDSHTDSETSGATPEHPESDAADSDSGIDDTLELEDEDPPLLKYSRLNQLPPNFFKKDPVSKATFSEDVFVFGTHSGLLLLTTPELKILRTFKAHQASILSLYTDGQYFASGSMDGTVVIGSVSDASDITMVDYKRPIHAVVLEKNYQKSRGFVCGGMAGDVIYSTKNWLDQRVDTVLEKDKGPITAIRTVDDLVLWTNDDGITIYHISTKRVISVISKPSDSFRGDLYWPRVSFPETDRVLLAWGNYIWSLRVHAKGRVGGPAGAGSSMKSRILPSAASFSFRTAVEKKVVVEHVYKVDYLISGISSFNFDQWVVLAYNPPEKDESGKQVAQNPDLKIINSLDGTVVHEEELALNSIEGLGLNDYNLLRHIGPSSTQYYIMSARDCVVAQQVELDDRLDWYLSRGLFHKAWAMSQHLVTPTKRLQFGLRHLDSLVKADDWDEAKLWLSQLLSLDKSEFPVGDTKSTLATRVSAASQSAEKEEYVKEVVAQWNSWGEIFIKSGHSKELTDVIPADVRYNISKSVYTDLLKYWLGELHTSQRAHEVLDSWDVELFDIKTIAQEMELVLESRDDTTLRRKLCKLYECSEPTKAVPHFCHIKDAHIIEYLYKNHVLTSFIPDIPKFIKFQFENSGDIETLPIADLEPKLKHTIGILVDSRFEIFPKTIVNLMTENRLDVVSFFYLERLATIDEYLVSSFGNKRIGLYSQFDRPKLLPYLMSDKQYDISEAISVCESNGFVDELVYLLGKTGEHKRALSLIMKELDDPDRAIKFAKSQNDGDTWDILLNYSFTRPRFLKALIEQADDQSSRFYNPMTILQNMSTDVEIEGLKDSITKVSLDNDMNVLVSQLILKIVYKRSEELSKKFYQDKLQGYEIATREPALRAIFDYFETAVVSQKKHHSQPVIKLVSDLVDDEHATKSYTDLQSKVQHIRQLNRKLAQEEAMQRD